MKRKIITRINNMNPLYAIGGYLLLIFVLVLFKIKPYYYNLSSLIGIWKGFVVLNPSLIERSFIVYNDGGYDGQFFYLIAKSLYTNGFNSFPILDSFFLRFNRIGLSILVGFFSYLSNFQFYPIITLSVLLFAHLYSFWVLRKILTAANKYLSYFYLFSPFSLNSILLLVSDSLFVSFSIILIYLLIKNGFSLESFPQKAPKQNWSHYLWIGLLASFTCFIKESGIVIIATLLLICIIDRNFYLSVPLVCSGGFYIFLTMLFKIYYTANLGTNPLGFADLIDYPLLGFIKSIQFKSFTDTKSIFREMAKFPIFLFYILLCINMLKSRSLRAFVFQLPIVFVLFTAGVGEVGYWLSFDNISRMFTISIPWIILIKQSQKAHNDYYALTTSIFLFFLLLIRIIYIKSAMEFYVY